MATPAGMSWAERAKAKHVSATNQKPGVPPNQASTAPSANGTHPASVPSSSSSRSNPSAHEHEADEETPASSLAPSAASVEDHLEAKPVHKPAPSPSVNIWTLRQQTRQPQPKAPRASPSSTTRSMSTKSHHADSQGDAAATNSNGSQEPAQPQPESRSAGPSGVTTASTALPPSSNDDHNISTSASTTASQSLKGAWKPFKKPVTRDISSENDATAWPSPDAAAASIALDKKKAASTQAQKPESESATDRVKSEKKKAKWIPIQADITVKPSHPLKKGHMESLQRKQEASRNSSNGFKQHRSQPSASSSSTQRHQRETSAASSSARAPSSTRPESRASAISEHPLAPAPASASRRPSLTLAHVPPVDHQGSCGQPQNAHLASPSVQQTPQTGMSNLSNLSAPFVYEPSSALYAPLNDTSPQGLEKKASISSPTFESYHPHDLHGPILPGSYTRRGRGGSSSGKSTRGLGPSRNSTSSRNNHQPDSPSSRSHSGRNGNLSHYSFPSYEAYPAAYPAFDFYPQGQAWYAVNGGFYPTLPTAQYMHYQPAIGPYVDGGTGLPFERPHPNNYHLLVDPPLEPTSYWVLGQIEFYMSEDNLARDSFLRQQMDTEGWIDIGMLASFKRIQSLTADLDLIFQALARSTVLEVRPGQVRRRGDWHKWVMPCAKPSSHSASVDDEALKTVSRRPSVQEAPHLYTEPINVEAHPVPEGLSPHSQHPLIIGSREVPPKRLRSPAVKKTEFDEEACDPATS